MAHSAATDEGTRPSATLDGVVERLTYVNPENGYTVAKVQPSGKNYVVAVVGSRRTGPGTDEPLAEALQGVHVVDPFALDRVIASTGARPSHQLGEEPAEPLRLEGLAVPERRGREQVLLRARERHVARSPLLVLLLVPERVRERLHVVVEHGQEVAHFDSEWKSVQVFELRP